MVLIGMSILISTQPQIKVGPQERRVAQFVSKLVHDAEKNLSSKESMQLDSRIEYFLKKIPATAIQNVVLGSQFSPTLRLQTAIYLARRAFDRLDIKFFATGVRLTDLHIASEIYFEIIYQISYLRRPLSPKYTRLVYTFQSRFPHLGSALKAIGATSDSSSLIGLMNLYIRDSSEIADVIANNKGSSKTEILHELRKFHARELKIIDAAITKDAMKASNSLKLWIW